MSFLELAKKRYSCKRYKSEQITKEQLDYILECGRVAPTAKNVQPQRIYVVNTKEGLEKIDQVTICRYNAPTVLIVCYSDDGIYTYPGTNINSGSEDASIVATHMMLGAADVGVDSCWLNRFNPDECKKMFNLPENETPVLLLDLGYSDNMGPLPNHESIKPIEETVKYIK
ncbi:MAG: nitroreductase family protein [Bacilli bacterium]|nr:nitroreductase family protein [Bacilli bacterium]